MNREPRPYLRQLLLVAAVSIGGLACAGEDSSDSHTAETALRQAERVGVVPGVITLSNGDTIVRPLAGIGGDVSCLGSDFDMHDDADTLFYRKDGEVVEVDVGDVTGTLLTLSEHADVDRADARFLLRQCVTTEGPVILEQDGDGYCVPVGEPNPDSRRIAVGRPVDVDEVTSVLSSNC